MFLNKLFLKGQTCPLIYKSSSTICLRLGKESLLNQWSELKKESCAVTKRASNQFHETPLLDQWPLDLYFPVCIMHGYRGKKGTKKSSKGNYNTKVTFHPLSNGTWLYKSRYSQREGDEYLGSYQLEHQSFLVGPLPWNV